MSNLILCPKCKFPIALEGGMLIGGYRLCCPDCEWESKIYDTEDEALIKGATDSK
ncbi:MAG: hypothetical protein JEY79_01190 [Pseudodesulfovibrio sp.]|nr:hypothetical protein [Pseudodesulfovibrio sp.]